MAEDGGGRARRYQPANHRSAALVLRADPKWIHTHQPRIVVSKNLEGMGGVRRAMETAAVEYGGGNAHRGGDGRRSVMVMM